MSHQPLNAFIFLTLFQTIPGFFGVCSTSLENTVGKGEIARNEQFLLFPLCFLPVWRSFLSFSSNMKLSSANSFNLEESKICRLGKGQRLNYIWSDCSENLYTRFPLMIENRICFEFTLKVHITQESNFIYRNIPKGNQG